MTLLSSYSEFSNESVIDKIKMICQKENWSLAQFVNKLNEDEKSLILDSLGDDQGSLLYDWSFWGRPNQIPPDIDWYIFAMIAGRGAGKTRSGAEWVNEVANEESGRRIALVSRTAADVRDVMIMGDSGIMNVGNPENRPEYFTSKRLLVWPNGTQAQAFSSEEPDQLRGPQFRLSVDTPILTTGGWKTMGTLEDTDKVFDEMGNPCNVTTHPIAVATDVYEIGFSDGTKIQADSQHLWVTLNKQLCDHLDYKYGNQTLHDNWATREYPYRADSLTSKDKQNLYRIWEDGGDLRDYGVTKKQNKYWKKKFKDGWKPEDHPQDDRIHPITTETIRETLNSGDRFNHLIPLTQPLTIDGPTVGELPVHPWVLGLALGDADTRSCKVIASNVEDIDETRELLHSFGVNSVEKAHQKIHCPDLINVWKDRGDKYIPDNYLLADEQSRLFLLQGLIDSDGCLDNQTDKYVFYNTNQDIVDGARFLAHSLGLKNYVYKKTNRNRYGVPNKDVWVLHIYSETPLALLSRKQRTVELGRRHKTRTITSVTPIDPVEMRCITVDSESHLYLAGEGLIPTHNTHAWADEPAAWKHTEDDSGLNAWDNLTIATRLGDNPQIFATTTPKRTPFMYDLLEQEKNYKEGKSDEIIIITRGTTMDNIGNLSKKYVNRMLSLYEGTHLAEQELYGQMLEEVDGALWNDGMISDHRVNALPAGQYLKVISVDPSVAEDPNDECGIVVVAASKHKRLSERHAYVLADESIQGSPAVWAQKVVDVWLREQCPVVAEVNQGGALVAAAIHAIDDRVPILTVHAKQGKKLRAEPVALKYEKGQVHHVGVLALTESQMTSWVPGETKKSPDRVDALVHGVTALLIKPPSRLGSGKIRAKRPSQTKLNFKTGKMIGR